MDIVWNYPLELYEKAQNLEYPWNVDVLQIDDVLGTQKQYESMGFLRYCFWAFPLWRWWSLEKDAYEIEDSVHSLVQTYPNPY